GCAAGSEGEPPVGPRVGAGDGEAQRAGPRSEGVRARSALGGQARSVRGSRAGVGLCSPCMTRLALIASLLLASAAARAAPDDRVVVATLRDWHPQYHLDEHGEPTGFAIELFAEVVARSDLVAEYRLYDTFAEAIADLEAGRID